MRSKKPDSDGPSGPREAADGWSRSASSNHAGNTARKPRGVWSAGKAPKTLLEHRLPQNRKPLFSGLKPDEKRKEADTVTSSRKTVPYTPGTEAELLFGERHSHDAWTVDRLVRRSTVPPVDRESLDRILEDKAYQVTPSAAPRSLPAPLSTPATQPNLGEALDLVERSDRATDPPTISGITADMVEEMEELYAVDDFTGALRIAELILGGNPDHEQACRCAEMCRSQLEQLYINKIGSLDRVPVSALKDADLRWLGLDHRAGFVLSRVDGKATVEELVDICGMPRMEVFKTLIELLNQGAINVVER
jgi:hypothetical protein